MRAARDAGGQTSAARDAGGQRRGRPETRAARDVSGWPPSFTFILILPSRPDRLTGRWKTSRSGRNTTVSDPTLIPWVKYGVRSPKFIWAPCAQLYSLAETPQPPPLHLGAPLVSQDRRHLFVTQTPVSLLLRVPSIRTDLSTFLYRGQSLMYKMCIQTYFI
jgi:hypothetical protein